MQQRQNPIFRWPPTLRTFAAAAAAVVFVGGCAVGPAFQAPPDALQHAVLAPRQTGAGALDLQADPVPAAWWTLFNDEKLSALESRVAGASLDLQAAASRVRQSRALLGVASAQSLPGVGASTGYSRAANSANGPLAALGAPSTPYDLWQTGFEANWEIDLWGQAASNREAASANVQASIFDQESIRVFVSAEVARNYLLLRGVQANLEILRQNRDIGVHALRLATSRQANGVATRFETSAARAQLATVDALAFETGNRRDRLMNALALLLGEPPRQLDGELGTAMPAPLMPQRLPVGVPSELSRRRPDIQRAEAQLRSATAAIGAAKADFYPRISLKGSLGLLAFDGQDLGNWSSRQFSVGPTIYLPIFQGGRLQSTLALTEARQQSAAIAYQQTVLQAWHEVDNALGALEIDAAAP
jgi:NodT family efflux transporter outer membrane factor (OMF) lipoprotein